MLGSWTKLYTCERKILSKRLRGRNRAPLQLPSSEKFIFSYCCLSLNDSISEYNEHFFFPYCRCTTGMPCQVKSRYQSLLTVLRLFGIGLLLPAPKAEVITGPTVLRCFIKYLQKINIWHANLAAILLETTVLKVDNSSPQKVFFKGVYQRKIQELLSDGWMEKRYFRLLTAKIGRLHTRNGWSICPWCSRSVKTDGKTDD